VRSTTRDEALSYHFKNSGYVVNCTLHILTSYIAGFERNTS